jgi:hypothetical protein
MRILPRLVLGAALAFSAGCAGYRLGPTDSLPAGARSVRVDPFVNETLQPYLGDQVTYELRKDIQRDGTFHLDSHDDPDIVVSGVIHQYERRALSFVPSDVLTVQDYRINVKADVTARDKRSGKVLFSQTVTGYTLVRVGSDLTSAERQALPLLAGDLAKNVAQLLVDGSW